MFTGPHHTSSLLVSSYTIRLSLGLRPVFLPEKLISAPEDEMTAPSLRIASSYSEAIGALRCGSARAGGQRRWTHFDVYPIKVEACLREILQLFAEELVLLKLVVMMSVRSHGE